MYWARVVHLYQLAHVNCERTAVLVAYKMTKTYYAVSSQALQDILLVERSRSLVTNRFD